MSLALGLALAGCASTPSPLAGRASRPDASAVRSDVAISRPPFREVHVEWKQRLEQPYVFVELEGDYADVLRWMGVLLEQVAAQGLAPAGAPFALYYDDPARTPKAELRSRLAVPVSTPQAAVAAPLGFDVLAPDNVVYARVAGPYGQAQGSYPGLFRFLGERGWAMHGPIRESFLVDPFSVRSPEELITEVQIAWRAIY